MLFHNNHDGTFTDVTEKAGVANERWGFGVAVGDYDNDGWPDIYVANYGKNRLYHNNHDGTFTDVAEKAGVALGGWSTGPTWGDYDHDGRLDLFVPGICEVRCRPSADRGRRQYPAKFLPVPRRRRDVRAARACPASPIICSITTAMARSPTSASRPVSRIPTATTAWLPSFVDVDDDGWMDLLVANDSTPNFLYRNRQTALSKM